MKDKRFSKKAAAVVLSLLLITVSIGFSVTSSQDADLEVTYIANAGVLIGFQEKKVLIDGLYRYPNPLYGVLQSKNLERIETAKPPFKSIDVLLVTHQHRDHFYPGSIGRHMLNNTGSILVTNGQVIEELRKGFQKFPAIEQRIKNAGPGLKQVSTFKIDGITIQSIKIIHGNPRKFKHIANNGYLINLKGKKLFHPGDGKLNESYLKQFNLGKNGIFIAFIPYWELYTPSTYKAIQTYLKPKYITAIHIPPQQVEDVKKELSQISTDIILFTEQLRKRSFH
jgi:L-ascorbate metabolism protein UlaG (beta-lactamase superfamily)